MDRKPSFNITIIEDCGGTRGILDSLLLEKIRRASEISLPAWPMAADIDFEIDTVSESVIEDLSAAESKEEMATILDEYCSKHPDPDLLILDLALSKEQATALDTAHGAERMGINDPHAVLEGTSGFRILKLWKDRCPVLITTYAKNPHVVTRCLDAGAHDVILKPFTDEEMNWVHNTWKNRDAKIANPGEEAIHEAEQRMPAIKTYVRSVVHEVLKSIRMVALRELEGAAPAHVPFWLATDVGRMQPGTLEGTNLMLIDVRGFSKLGQEGRSNAYTIFDVMDAIWTRVFEVLKDHDAEVNNILGDAALAFRGVYGAVRAPVSLADTLACARLTNELFEPDRPLREELVKIIEERYKALRDTESEAHEKMLELVRDPNFGVRVLSIEPDEPEALYGRVGPDHRWQHTILSRFMNFLARSESAISGWEREPGYERQRGESFLLWRKDRKDQPDFDGFSFQLPEEFLGRPREQIKDVPEHVEVFRVVPTGG